MNVSVQIMRRKFNQRLKVSVDKISERAFASAEARPIPPHVIQHGGGGYLSRTRLRIYINIWKRTRVNGRGRNAEQTCTDGSLRPRVPARLGAGLFASSRAYAVACCGFN